MFVFILTISWRISHSSNADSKLNKLLRKSVVLCVIIALLFLHELKQSKVWISHKLRCMAKSIVSLPESQIFKEMRWYFSNYPEIRIHRKMFGLFLLCIEINSSTTSLHADSLIFHHPPLYEDFTQKAATRSYFTV